MITFSRGPKVTALTGAGCRIPLFRALPLLVLGAMLHSAAVGATILTNIGATPNGDASISGNTGTAIGFTINPGADLNLVDAMFTLFNGINGSPAAPIDLATSPLGVGIYADSGGQPNGSALVTLSLSTGTIAGGEGTYTATPNSPFVLSGGTTYWLVLNDHDNSLLLDWEGTATLPTTSGATYAGAAQGTMNSATQVSNGSFSVAANGFLVQLDADPVPTGGAPEPGSMFLLAGGILGLSLRRLRQFKAPTAFNRP